VVKGTALIVGRSRDRSPVVSLEIFSLASAKNIVTTMYFLFRIGFLMLSEALVLSEEKSEIFPRAFTIADMFVFEMRILAYRSKFLTFKQGTTNIVLFSILGES
jgi:hypothetical protein